MSSAAVQNVDAHNDEQEDSSTMYTSILPAATIDKMIRRKFGGKPVYSTTARYTSGAIEHIFAELITAAGDEAKLDKKKRIKMIHLMRATRAHPGLSRLFRNYMFAPKQRVDFRAIDLLPPKERVVVLKERMQKKQQKKDSEIPGVNEE